MGAPKFMADLYRERHLEERESEITKQMADLWSKLRVGGGGDSAL